MNRDIEKIILDLKGLVFQEKGPGNRDSLPKFAKNIDFESIFTI